MPIYFCGGTCGIKDTFAIGEVLERAPRPYTASEIAQITGIPINVVLSFLIRNCERRRVTMRPVIRREKSNGKNQREYWRGSGSISYTFGRGKMLSQEQARELAQGRRPVQWRETASTVWSVDETETLAVRRGDQVISSMVKP